LLTYTTFLFTNDVTGTLQEAILMQSELGDLVAEAKGLAEGVIIEAKTSKGQGPVATMLVRRGELKLGANVVAGTVLGLRQDFALEDAIGSHPCLIEANMRVTNDILLGCSLFYDFFTCMPSKLA
jgi:hypothetical protein